MCVWQSERDNPQRFIGVASEAAGAAPAALTSALPSDASAIPYPFWPLHSHGFRFELSGVSTVVPSMSLAAFVNPFPKFSWFNSMSSPIEHSNICAMCPGVSSSAAMYVQYLLIGASASSFQRKERVCLWVLRALVHAPQKEASTEHARKGHREQANSKFHIRWSYLHFQVGDGCIWKLHSHHSSSILELEGQYRKISIRKHKGEMVSTHVLHTKHGG